MYSYCFIFYKPGKREYSNEEIQGTIDTLYRAGCKLNATSFSDPHIKEGKFRIDLRETNLNLNIEKSGCRFTFHLHPAQEESHGAIGGLFIPEEQFRENSKNNSTIMLEIALAICFGLKPLFAWGDHELEISKLEPWLSFDEIKALAWNNQFSKELVDRLGGLENVLLFPKEKEDYLDLYLVQVSLWSDPTEPTRSDVALQCRGRYPEAQLRQFEISSMRMERAK